MSVSKPRTINVKIREGKPIDSRKRLALVIDECRRIPFARAVIDSLRKDASAYWMCAVLLESFTSNFIGARDDDDGRLRVSQLQERLAKAEGELRERKEGIDELTQKTVDEVVTEQKRLDAEYKRIAPELAIMRKAHAELIELRAKSAEFDKREARLAQVEREAQERAIGKVSAELRELREESARLRSENEQAIESKRRLRESLERTKKENEQLRAQLKETA